MHFGTTKRYTTNEERKEFEECIVALRAKLPPDDEVNKIFKDYGEPLYCDELSKAIRGYCKKTYKKENMFGMGTLLKEAQRLENIILDKPKTRK